MRKFFTLFTVLAALFCLTSCNLDKEATFTFFYRIEGVVADEEAQEALVGYFEGSFLKESMSHMYTCKSSEAMEKALNQMAVDIQQADDELIYSYLNAEGDYVDLIGWLSGDKVSTWVGTRTWSYDQKDSDLIE